MAEHTAALQAQIDELKQQVAALSGTPAVPAAEPGEPVAVSRRAAFGKAAAIAAGAVGGAILLERPAAAANGGNFVLGQANSATAVTELDVTVASGSKLGLFVNDNSGFNASDSGMLAALGAWSASHAGLYAYSDTGVGARLVGGSAAVNLFAQGSGVSIRSESGGVPSTGTHQPGEYGVSSSTDGISACIIEGTPGTWANIGFNPTTGTARVLDTRTGTGAPNAPFASGAAHSIAVRGHATIPNSLSVRAVAYAITVNSPSANGYLKVGPDSSTQATVANFTKGVSISSSGITGLKSDGSILVTVFGASAEVVIDLTGYFV